MVRRSTLWRVYRTQKSYRDLLLRVRPLPKLIIVRATNVPHQHGPDHEHSANDHFRNPRVLVVYLSMISTLNQAQGQIYLISFICVYVAVPRVPCDSD